MSRFLHPIQALRRWWRSIVYTYGCDDQTTSDRITSRTGWPE